MTAHSYSSISTWKNCPRQYHERYVTRRWKDPGSAATRKGNLIHKEIEDYIKGERDAPPSIRPEGDFDTLLRSAKKLGVPVGVETPLAVTKDLEPCGFWDDEAWLRGKLDAVLALPGVIYASDWKTGKRRRDATRLQASVYSVLLDAAFPGNTIKVVFDYLNNGRDAPLDVEPKADLEVVRRYADAIENAEVWPPKPSGLCRFCPVLDCEFNEKEEGE